jgi:transposase
MSRGLHGSIETESKNTMTQAPSSIPGPQMGRRRRFTNDEKRRFLTEASLPGESMSSVGRRYGLSVSLLFRWRRQLDGAATRVVAKPTEATARAEVRELRDRLRELERLLGKKTLESELLKQELARLGHKPDLAALAALEPSHLATTSR